MTPALPLAGLAAIVTGASMGAGRGYARALARAGAQVVVADCHEEQGQETVALIKEAGGSARYADLDVADEQSTQAVAAFAAGTYGRLDILVNDAATYGATPVRALEEVTVEEWDRIMTVFVRGPWLMSKAALPFLVRSPHPSIINHTSTAAYGVNQWLHCSAARGAVISMTKSMAIELARRNVRVNAIAVGGVGVEAVALGARANAGQLSAAVGANQLVRRLGTEDDLAGAVVLLASAASSYMTGQTIVLDGGRFLLG